MEDFVAVLDYLRNGDSEHEETWVSVRAGLYHLAEGLHHVRKEHTTPPTQKPGGR